MEHRIIDETRFVNDLIRPRDLTVTNINTIGCFGKCETEQSAGMLVKFFQKEKKNRWLPFTLSELLCFYLDEKQDANKMFYGLTGFFHDDGGIGSIKEADAFLIFDAMGFIYVTDAFINRCAKK